MLEKVKKSKFIIAVVASSLLFTGCFGSMALTKKVYNWNQNVSGNKVVQSLIFWGMIIVPIYEITSFVDAVFLNTVEFWTGSNPIAMSDGEKEIQVVENKVNEKFEITATKNRFDIKQLEGENQGITKTYVYNQDKKTWYKLENNKLTKISQIEDNMVTLFTPGGKEIVKELH